MLYACGRIDLTLVHYWQDLETEKQRADELASHLAKSSEEIGQLREQAAAGEAALGTLQKQLKSVTQQNEVRTMDACFDPRLTPSLPHSILLCVVALTP